MSTNWVGPRRISRILADFTVEIEHLLTDATRRRTDLPRQAVRRRSVGTPAKCKEVAEFTDRIWYSVDKIKDVVKFADRLKF